jgi:hypothetical protein
MKAGIAKMQGTELLRTHLGMDTTIGEKDNASKQTWLVWTTWQRVHSLWEALSESMRERLSSVMEEAILVHAAASGELRGTENDVFDLEEACDQVVMLAAKKMCSVRFCSELRICELLDALHVLFVTLPLTETRYNSFHMQEV